jgi:uncharacterized protein YjbI with pentapeptide repeats
MGKSKNNKDSVNDQENKRKKSRDDHELNMIWLDENYRNIKKTLDESSKLNRSSYIFFITFCIYAFIVIASTNEYQLLLTNQVRLPILNVDIPIIWFSYLVPLLLVSFHFNLLLNLSEHSIKVNYWEREVREGTKRIYLTPLYFQSGSIKAENKINEYLFYFARYITTFLFPLLILLYIQIFFSKLHIWHHTSYHFFMILVDLSAITFYWMRIVEKLDNIEDERNKSIGQIYEEIKQFCRKSALKSGLFVAPIIMVSFVNLGLVLVLTFNFQPNDNKYALVFPNIVAKKIDFNLQSNNMSRKIKLVLRDMDLKYADLTGSDLSGADMRYIKLNGAMLFFTKFNNVDARFGSFNGAFCRNAEFSNSKLKGSNFEGAALNNVTFENSNLEKAYLKGAKLKNSNFKNSRARKINLDRSNLINADFSNSFLRKSKIRRAVLDNANLDNADLEDADLEQSKLNFTTAQNTILEGSRLNGADLEFANLNGANLKRSKLHGAYIVNASLNGADLTDAELYGSIIKDSEFRSAKLKGVKLQGAVLNNVNLDGSYFIGAQFYGAQIIDSNCNLCWGIPQYNEKIDLTHLQKEEKDYLKMYKWDKALLDRYSETDKRIQKLGENWQPNSQIKDFNAFLRIRNYIGCEDLSTGKGLLMQYYDEYLDPEEVDSIIDINTNMSQSHQYEYIRQLELNCPDKAKQILKFLASREGKK